MASIGKLVTHLVVDSNNFDKGIGASQKLVGGFSKFVKRSLQVGVAASFAAAGVAVVTLKTQLESLDRVAKLATRTGFDPAAIAAFGFAAEQSGSSVEVANKALDKFTRSIGEASTGVGLAKTQLESMGIPLDDFVKLSPEKQLLKVANAISELPTEAVRANAAFSFFGRGGQELVNVLALGEDGIKDFMSEAKGLGLGFSVHELKNIENANDAINRLKRNIGAIGAVFTVKVAPAVETAVTAMRASFAEFSDWMRPKWSAVQSVAVGTWKVIESAASTAWGAIRDVAGDAFKAIGFDGPSAFDDFATSAVKALAIVESAFNTLESSIQLVATKISIANEKMFDAVQNKARAAVGLPPIWNPELMELQLNEQKLQFKILNDMEQTVADRLKAMQAIRNGPAGAGGAAAPPTPVIEQGSLFHGGAAAFEFPKPKGDDVDQLAGIFGTAFENITAFLGDLPDQTDKIPEIGGEPPAKTETRFAGAMEAGSAEAMKLLAMQVTGGKIPEKQLTESRKQTGLLKSIWTDQNRRDEPKIFTVQGAVS